MNGDGASPPVWQVGFVRVSQGKGGFFSDEISSTNDEDEHNQWNVLLCMFAHFSIVPDCVRYMDDVPLRAGHLHHDESVVEGNVHPTHFQLVVEVLSPSGCLLPLDAPTHFEPPTGARMGPHCQCDRRPLTPRACRRPCEHAWWCGPPRRCEDSASVSQCSCAVSKERVGRPPCVHVTHDEGNGNMETHQNTTHTTPRRQHVVWKPSLRVSQKQQAQLHNASSGHAIFSGFCDGRSAAAE